MRWHILRVTAYSCHGSWEEDGVSYVIATPVARKSTDALRYCFIYTLANQPQSSVIEGSLGKGVGPPVLRLSAVSESCHRHIVPGVNGNFAFNFTSNGNNSKLQICVVFYRNSRCFAGTCAESDDVNSCPIVIPTVFLILSSVVGVIVIR